MSGFSSSPFEEKGNHYSVAVDMNYFHPSEMSVKVIDNTVVVVEAKHKERADDQYGCISRHFLHRYRLPNNVDPASITSDLSDKGILTVTAKKVRRRYHYHAKHPSLHAGVFGQPKVASFNASPPPVQRERRKAGRTGDHHTHQQEVVLPPKMETESYNESDYISDDYAHPNPDLFYSVTRTPGKGVPESAFRRIECGCKCPLFQCTEQNNCSCLKYGANYKTSDDGLLLVKEKFENVPVFECNSQCSCIDGVKNMEANKKPSRTSCPNRNVQFGPIEGLEVFEAGPKGWGLKTKKKIPSGRFICEYAGEVISLEEAKKRQKANRGMNYVFVLREFTGNSLSGVTCVDPTHVGNIGRYINHSCEPNSAIVPVRVNDVIPWLCVFAVRDIQENEEICYDYSGLSGSNEAEDDASPERKPCFCGSPRCKKFLPFEVEI